MKKTIIFVILLLAVCSFCLMACQEEPIVDSVEKSVTLYIVLDGEELAKYERTTEAATVADLFNSLANEENSQFAFSSSTSIYGQFLNSVTVSTDTGTWVSVGLFPESSKSEFCAFYHTLNDIKYRDYTVDSRTYTEKQFYFSAVGINGAPLIDGASYLITIDTY